MKHWTDKLVELNACEEAVEFGRGFKTFQAAWDACDRGDWMIWIAGKCSGEPESKKRKKLVFVAAQCARLALKYTKDPRVKKCIEVCEAWSKGKATTEELRAARNSASAAAYSAAAESAAYAASAAAAESAAYAASAAAYSAARYDTLKKCANIVRKYYPKPPRGEA